MTEATLAIQESTQCGTIVHLSNCTDDTHAELLAACDDSADQPKCTEYWGTTDDGATWRVHAN